MEKTKEVSKKVETPKAETVKKSYKTEIPELLTFLQAGAHFGHKHSAWNPKMKKYIYEVRNGIHIIDIVKSRKMLTQALDELAEVVDKGNVLIVGTKGQAAGIIEKMAKEVGAFYVTKRWPGGLFTNFDAIKGSIQTLVKMEERLASGGEGLVKKEVLLMQKDVDRLNKIYEGIKFMDELPKFLIVIDSMVEKNAINEANISNVSVIALIDTNCDPDLVDYPIPANDDSIKSINLFVNLFGDIIKQGKKSQSLVALRKKSNKQLLTIGIVLVLSPIILYFLKMKFQWLNAPAGIFFEASNYLQMHLAGVTKEVSETDIIRSSNSLWTDIKMNIAVSPFRFAYLIFV
ncbi:MAG TPA: 30S ribosomal protein S2, partial [Candidatus Dojkabacteria bacterium]|nr:30S ribosomal protein S2 [Candidatus Dojkabacteria bacterium]